MIHNFSPYGADTVNITATTSSNRVALNLPTAPVNPDVRIYNAGTVPVFIVFGDSTVTATTARMPIPPGAVEVFTMGAQATHMAGITASGSAVVYATTGRGS